MATASSVTPKLAKRGCPHIYKYMMGLLGLSTAALSYNFQTQAARERDHALKGQQKLSNAEVRTIWGHDAVNYPWAKNPEKNYEFDLVKMRGYFKEERFLVSRQKDGKKGFAVFAPFVTSHANLNHHPYSGDRNQPSGIMVNLGWVPLENQMDIEADPEPLEKIDLEGLEWPTHDEWRDQITGFKYKKEYDEEKEEAYPFTDVTGILRKGERANPFIGNTNIPEKETFQYVDTLYMKLLFRFVNTIDFDDYYLERVVEDLEDPDAYPIPATKTSFLLPNAGPDLYSKWGTRCGIVSGLSLLTLAGMVLR